ncbi:MAG: ABC transporter ATP-binding protein [Ruminococcaceae bacterium]|nr:ABC transporter ATP-binding protein [Oscillospiraceae bacterium]
MGRYIKIHEDIKVPVAKNIFYALRVIWKAEKALPISYVLSRLTDNVFELFIQNILFLKVLLSVFDSGGDFKAYFKDLILFFIVAAVCKISSWALAYVRQVAAKKTLKSLNNMVFEKAASLDVSCYENPEFYDKYQRANLVLTSSYFDLICSDIADIVSGIIALILVIVTVASVNPVYLLFLLPTVFVFLVETFKSKAVYRRDLKMTGNNRTKAYIQRTVFLKDFSKDMRTSNIFAVMMKRFKAAIDANVEILGSYGWKLFLYSVFSTALSEFIPIVGTYAYAGYQFAKKSSMTVSGFSVVVSSINTVREATLRVAEGFDDMTQMALYFQNLRDFFEYESKIVSGTKKVGNFESLEFRNVSFRYPSASKNSVNNVSFKLNKGEKLAVVGVNGAGKSTLVKLILRFYDADEGEILLNGVNVKEYDLESLRTSFATVFQDYRNFAVSVFENVICRECSDEDKKRAEEALKKAGVWEKIRELPSGGDTLLTREFDRDGAGLSGGENQKVSAARLFASNFEVAILDEPSSALDPIAEYKMYENLIKETENKTVIYISHRLSSAVLSDRIIVLEGGRIIETGSHSELMKSGGRYSEMFALQASGYNREGDDNE